MDIQMPLMNGLEATRQITQTPGNTCRILILTTFERDDYVFEALRAGASGFILKNAPPEDLIAAVRIVAEGNALLAPSVTRRIINEFAQRTPRSRPESQVKQPDRTGNRSNAADCQRQDQCGNRGGAFRRGNHGENTYFELVRQAGFTRPCPGSSLCLRKRLHSTRRIAYFLLSN